MFTIESRTTPMFHRTHVVTTDSREFARQLLEEARTVDFEPDFEEERATYRVGFVAADIDAQTVIASALEAA